MNIIIHSQELSSQFCDLTSSLNKSKRIESFLEDFHVRVWKKCEETRFDPKKIVCNIPLAFLFRLTHEPKSALCTKEMAILKKTKQLEKQTRFFLNTPGFALISLAALVSAVAGGAGYYYGVKGGDLSVVSMALLVGLGTLVGAFASNALGFYITGTLPNNASEAENAEQNMWDDFAQLKTKPAAYQLLEWYCPKKQERESEDLFQARRQVALYFIEKMDIEKIVPVYKSIATQSEKIDIAFRYLEEAVDLISKQKSFEETACIPDVNPGELRLAARLLNYFS